MCIDWVSLDAEHRSFGPATLHWIWLILRFCACWWLADCFTPLNVRTTAVPRVTSNNRVLGIGGEIDEHERV
jgi:hypothetical protein